MKSKKSISLFFSYILIGLCVGIGLGVNFDKDTSGESNHSLNESKINHGILNLPESIIVHEEDTMSVAAKEDKITADTTYLVLEKDLNTGEIQTKHLDIPDKYIGLNREQVLEQLDDYEANPPLSELENGFVSLELISFSPRQLEVQMNYQYIVPTGIFYIVAYDHKVVVMLEDMKTVFLSTEIHLSQLPSEIQQDVMRGLFIPNEECLYDFLETYTS